MEVKLIIFEVYPPVSEIVKANEGLIITLLTDHCERFINVGDSLSNPKGSLFKSNDNSIKFGLFRGTEYLGIGEFQINNEVRWVTVHNDTIKKSNTSNAPHSLPESIRLRVKCSPLSFSSKALNSSSKSKAYLNQLSDSKASKKPVTRISNLMGGLSQPKLDKKNVSSVTVAKQPSDHKLSYSKPLMTKSIQNKSTENHFTVLNTDMYFSTYTKNSLQSNKKRKQINHTQAKSIHNNPTESGISTRTEYKTNFTQSKIKSCDYNYSLPNKTSLEDQIIDQSFENNIRKDEVIGQKITESSIEEKAKSIDDEEDAAKEAFAALMNDFFILYDDDYLEQLPLQNIQLEAGLYIEKVAELQAKYHEAMKEMNTQYLMYSKKTEELNNNILKLIKMKNSLALLAKKSDYAISKNTNQKEKNNFISLHKEELLFWSKAIDKCNHVVSSPIHAVKNCHKLNLKDSLIDIMRYIFSENNPKKDLIAKAKSSILNPAQAYFLGKILNKAKHRPEQLIKINRSEEVSLTIENLKNNLKSKMLPILSTDTNPNTTNNVNNDSNPQVYQRILSQDSLEMTKSSITSPNHICKPSLKRRCKKSENDLFNVRSNSKKAFKHIK